MANKDEQGTKWGTTTPAWIAVIVTAATLGISIWTHSEDAARADREQLLEHRREALFSALKVIDLVYSNEPWNGNPAPHPLPVDVQQARDAYNQMSIYCQYPDTLVAFRSAIGVWNPQEDKGPNQPSIGALIDFRKQVAKELDLPTPVSIDDKYAWIENLYGAK